MVYLVTMYFYYRSPGTGNQIDFIAETWFMALLISMVTVMVVLFVAMLLMRRQQLIAKKSLPVSRSNGGVLVTPLSLKHDPPLWMGKDALPEYSTTLPEYSKLNVHGNGTQFSYINGPKECSAQHNLLHCNSEKQYDIVNIRANPLHQTIYGTSSDVLDKDHTGTLRKLSDLRRSYHKKLKDFGSVKSQHYENPNARPNVLHFSQVADYAEVNPNVIHHTNCITSPEPYATTTLVTGPRRVTHSLVSTMNNFM